jgi:hypothetical protein
MGLKTALVAILLALGSPNPVAAHAVAVISVADYVQRRIAEPEADLDLQGMDDEARKHIRIWQKRLGDRSLPVVGPCRHSNDLPPPVCRAPPLTFYPWSDVERNELLWRPAPEVVRANIRTATDGALSTVFEVVQRVNDLLDDLSVFPDSVISLLITNFKMPEPGLILGWTCASVLFDGWHWDLLVSEDERRALLAGFLHAISDQRYLERRLTDLNEALLAQGFKAVPGPAPEPGTHQCRAATRRGYGRFVDDMGRLAGEVLIPETEWVRRYEESQAVLRAGMYATVREMGLTWNHELTIRIEDMVAAATDSAREIIQRSVPMVEPEFMWFLDDQMPSLLQQYADQDCGILPYIAYRRWKTAWVGCELTKKLKGPGGIEPSKRRIHMTAAEFDMWLRTVDSEMLP